MNKIGKMKTAADLLRERISQLQPDNKQPPKQYITQEFQDFGYRLAMRLNEVPKKAMYIRIAKTVPRALIEDAASFASDYPKAKHKGKIFLWKLRELITEYKGKHPEFELPKLSSSKPKKAKKEANTEIAKEKVSKPKRKRAVKVTQSAADLGQESFFN